MVSDNLKLSRNEIRVLNALYKNKCTNEVKSMTIRNIANELKLSYYTVRNIIKSLIFAEFVKEGCKNMRASSYYITKKGILKIKELKGEDWLI